MSDHNLNPRLDPQAVPHDGSVSKGNSSHEPDLGSSNVKSNSKSNSNVNSLSPGLNFGPHDGTENTVEKRRLQNETDCARCKQLDHVIAALQASEAELMQDRDLADREVRRLRKANALLQRDLTALREADPKAKEIRDVLEHWKRALRKKGNTKTPIDGKRADAVRRAVRWGYSFEEVKKAIDGAARCPFVVDGRRVSEGPKERRYDDLETILKGEKQIDNLIALAATPEPARSLSPVRSAEPPVGIDELLGRLEAVRPAGLNQWTARCPAHDDRHASLSIGLGNRGIVLHCHTGCELVDIAGELRVSISSLFDEEPERRPLPRSTAEALPSQAQLAAFHGRLLSNPKLLDRLRELRAWSKPTVERLYLGFDGQRIIFPVHDEHGELVNVLRYLPGERPDGERKLLAARGRPRDLFPQPERFDADEVWLVEGEPDAVTGHEFGLTTVSVPGSNGWRTTWASRFRGRCVIVCFDADQPGRDAAQRVATSLIEEAREVRSVDLAPERTDGFDLSDFALAGGHVGELLRMAAASSAIHSLRAA